MRTVHETRTQAYLLFNAEFEFQRPRIQRAPDGAEWIWRGIWDPIGHSQKLPKVVEKAAERK